VISQDRAVSAATSGHVDAEIVSVTGAGPREDDGTGTTIELAESVVAHDDGPASRTTMEVLATLKPVFKPGRDRHRSNSCPLNDGAAAVLVMSAGRAERLGLRPRARILASTIAAVRAGVHGDRPGSRDPRPARAQRADDRGDPTSSRSMRPSRRRSLPCMRQLGHRRGAAQPVRRRDRARSPVRDDGCADHDDADQWARGDRRAPRIDAACVAGGMGQAMLVERI